MGVRLRIKDVPWQVTIRGLRYTAPTGWNHALRHDPCSYCSGVYPFLPYVEGRKNPPRHMTIDHVSPIHPIDKAADKGDNNWTNETAACSKCNQMKGSKKLLMFLHELHRNGIR